MRRAAFFWAKTKEYPRFLNIFVYFCLKEIDVNSYLATLERSLCVRLKIKNSYKKGGHPPFNTLHLKSFP
jgi:hypothetical protein